MTREKLPSATECFKINTKKALNQKSCTGLIYNGDITKEAKYNENKNVALCKLIREHFDGAGRKEKAENIAQFLRSHIPWLHCAAVLPRALAICGGNVLIL